MAAFELTTAGTTLIFTPSGDNDVVEIQNLGPNAIYIDSVTPVVTTTALQVPSGAVYSVPPGMRTAIYGRAVTADQTSPLDTRVQTWRAADV